MGWVSSSKTPIIYYGGKTGMLGHIMPLIPPHEVYTEAFFGGGAVFWSKDKAKNETINDRLDVVVNFYEQLKTNFVQLKPLIESTLISRTQHITAMRMLNGRIEATPVQKAWAFWLSSNFSFNNKLGAGIKYSNDMNSCAPVQLRNKKKRFTEWLVNRIEDATIENTDAKIVITNRNVKKAFHYIDPPYFNADMGHYKGFTEQDLEEVLQLCETITGRFMLSNYNSDLLDSYVVKNGWYKKEVGRRLKASVTKIKNKNEVLVLNYSPTCLIENRLFK